MNTNKAELIEWAEKQPDIKRRLNGKYVCATCGGNCGQCGMTGRFSILNDGETPPASMASLVKQISKRTRPSEKAILRVTMIIDVVIVSFIVCWFLWEALT